jgi:hypothetical protein
MKALVPGILCSPVVKIEIFLMREGHLALFL